MTRRIEVCIIAATTPPRLASKEPSGRARKSISMTRAFLVRMQIRPRCVHLPNVQPMQIAPRLRKVFSPSSNCRIRLGIRRRTTALELARASRDAKTPLFLSLPRSRATLFKNKRNKRSPSRSRATTPIMHVTVKCSLRDKFALFMSLCVSRKVANIGMGRNSPPLSLSPSFSLPHSGEEFMPVHQEQIQRRRASVYEFLNEIYQLVDAAKLSAEEEGAEQL